MRFRVYKNGKLLSNENLHFNNQKLIFIFHGLFGRAKNWHSIALKISYMFKGFLIVVCITITIALILFPLFVSYKEQKNKKK